MEERKLKFIDEVSTLQAKFVDDCIKIIDKYGYNRNREMMIILSTFDVANQLNINYNNYEVTNDANTTT